MIQADKSKPPSLAALFLGLARVGCTAFGGPAMIPYIRTLVVERRGWVAEEDFAQGMAATQMIPGATAMQAAAWAGMSARGASGALAAYLGFGLPAFVLMLGLSALYFASRDLPALLGLFQGLQVVVAALVCHAAMRFSRRYLTDWLRLALALAAGLWLGFGGNPILILVLVCLAGVVLFRELGPLPPCRDKGRAGQGQAALKQAVPDQAAFSDQFTPDQDAPDQDAPDQDACPQPARLSRALRACAIILVFTLAWMAVLFFLDREMFRLCLAMIKIDCFAFGGGYVTLPLMLHEVTANLKLMTEQVFMDGIALGQVTPGPIVMTAGFVGYALRGVAGAFCATVAVFTPSLLALILAHALTGKLIRSVVARRVLSGSLVTLVGLLAAVGARFAMGVDWGPWEVVIGLGALIALSRKVDVLWVVLAGAGLSAAVL